MILDGIFELFGFLKQKPKAKLSFQDGKLKVTNYNKAFIDDLRNRLGDTTDGKTDEEVIKLYTERENIEREEPKLEVLHAGLDEDGRVKMSLDWNRSFIQHLKEHGITGETEEEAIQNYLSLLTKEIEPEMMAADSRSADNLLGEAFREIDEESERELQEAAKLVAKSKRAENRAKRIAKRATK